MGEVKRNNGINKEGEKRKFDEKQGNLDQMIQMESKERKTKRGRIEGITIFWKQREVWNFFL